MLRQTSLAVPCRPQHRVPELLYRLVFAQWQDQMDHDPTGPAGQRAGHHSDHRKVHEAGL